MRDFAFIRYTVYPFSFNSMSRKLSFSSSCQYSPSISITTFPIQKSTQYFPIYLLCSNSMPFNCKYSNATLSGYDILFLFPANFLFGCASGFSLCNLLRHSDFFFLLSSVQNSLVAKNGFVLVSLNIRAVLLPPAHNLSANSGLSFLFNPLFHAGFPNV